MESIEIETKQQEAYDLGPEEKGMYTNGYMKEAGSTRWHYTR